MSNFSYVKCSVADSDLDPVVFWPPRRPDPNLIKNGPIRNTGNELFSTVTTAPIYSFYSRLLLFTPVSTPILLQSCAVSENCYLSSAGRGPVVRPVTGRPIGGELCHQHLPQVRRQGNGDHQRAEVEESHSRRYR